MADEKNKPEKKDGNRESSDQLRTQANDIIEVAKAGVKKESDNKVILKDEVSDALKGLPMRELIGAPLFAAAEAQQKLAATAWDFYQKIAFEEEEGKPSAKTRCLKFDLERPLEENGEVKMIKQTINAPFLGLVPIPSLLIDRIDIDFQMEVSDNNMTKSESAQDASTNISGGWFAVKANVSGKVSSSRENTRTTDQTAKYNVRVSASQQQQTEGLSKLMDIMASCIEPIAKESGKDPDPKPET